VCLGQSFIRSSSILWGSVCLVNPRRVVTRLTWVSTVIPGMLKAWPRTTFAVFRPTPARLVRSSRVLGTRPLNCLSSMVAVFFRLLALLLKKLMERMISLMSSTGASARAAIVGYFLNRWGVVRLTRASVHWAERITAIRS